MSNDDFDDEEERTLFDEWYRHQYEEPYEWDRRKDEGLDTPNWESWLQHKDVDFSIETADGTHWRFRDDSHYDTISEANDAAKAIADSPDNIHSEHWHGGTVGHVRVVYDDEADDYVVEIDAYVEY